MDIYTSQYRYSGEDRLDITVKGQDPVGKLFAPTWDMVIGTKKGTLTKKEYTKQYIDIITNVLLTKQDVVRTVLNRPRITFVCFCPAGAFCHRYLLAHAFVSMGAVYKGEIIL